MNIGFEFILRETAIGIDAKASMQLIEMDRKHKKEIGDIMEMEVKHKKEIGDIMEMELKHKKEICDIMERIDKMAQHYDSKIKALEKNNELRDNIITETAIEKESMQMIEMDKKHKKEIGHIMERMDKMAQHYDTKIKELEKNNELRDNILILDNQPINSQHVSITKHNLKKFPLFYNCKKLSIDPYVLKDLSRHKNISVEQLLINGSNGTNSTNTISYDGLQNMPSLKQLNIKTTYTHINREGPIEKSNFVIEINNIVNILSSYKHTIREINLDIKLNIDCGIHNLPTPLDVKLFSELQTYCKKNNIELIVQ